MRYGLAGGAGTCAVVMLQCPAAIAVRFVPSARARVVCYAQPVDHLGKTATVVELGTTLCSRDELESMLAKLRTKYTPSSYHLLKLNCNDFSLELARFLLPPDDGAYPAWILQVPRSIETSKVGKELQVQLDKLKKDDNAAGAEAQEMVVHSVLRLAMTEQFLPFLAKRERHVQESKSYCVLC